MNRLLLTSMIVLTALTGCAGGSKFTGGPGLQLTRDTGLPPPDGVDPSAVERPYRLGPMDKISVSVFGQEELSQDVRVDAAGSIALPMVGQVTASGLTPAELAEQVTQKLKGNYVRNPQVSVNLLEAKSQVVTVDGAVKEPGLFPVMGKMTLMRAVATAKGATEFAELTEVVVFRSVDGQRMAGLFSLKAIREGRYPDPELFAGDVVVVGDSPTRRMFRDIASLGGLLTAPLVAVVN